MTQSAARDISLDPTAATARALVVYVCLVAALVIANQRLWGVNPLRSAFHAVGGWPIALFVVVPAAVVGHELLHAIGWALGGAGWGPVRFGIKPSKLMVYAHYNIPLSARAYRVGASLPALAMGLLPSVVGLAWGHGAIAGWGALCVGFAAGDLVVLWSMRDVPSSSMVIDHPTRPGCQIVSDEAGAA
jgi:hypothetical protein